LSVWLELKAFGKWPKRDSSNVLEHNFSGPQVTFMKRALKNGGVGAGLIGFQEDRKWKAVFLLPHLIEDNGGVTKHQILRHHSMVVDDLFHSKLATVIKRASAAA
jgi:penicillin-binding protein-related factor A (putative recombinase)